MNITLKNVSLIVVAAVGLLLIGGALGRGCDDGLSERELNARLTTELEQLRVDHEGVVTVHNQEVSSLQELISSKNKEIGVQADLILKLRNAPAKVQYVVKTVTVLQPIDKPTTVSVKDLPAERLFGLATKDGEKIVTDRMVSKDIDGDSIPDEVTFTPYEQTITLDAALGETSSSFLLRAKSSYDDKFYDIPIEVQVTRISKDVPSRKVVDPTLALQVGGFAGGDILSRDPLAGWTAGVSMPWLHPMTSLDLLSPSVSLGTSWRPGDGSSAFIIRGGATIISYNVGGSGDGILRDTWVGADIGVATDLGLSGGLVIATRL